MISTRACFSQSLFYPNPMKHSLRLLIAAVLPMGFGLVSCADRAEPKPVGPTSDTSNIPWNTPVPGQGQGQFGMLPQNQYRR